MNTEFITKPAGGFLSRALSNPHTSIAAGVWVAASVIPKLGTIWFPAHAEQFKQTTDIIKEAAVAYGFFMGGDAKPRENAVDGGSDSATPKT